MTARQVVFTLLMYSAVGCGSKTSTSPSAGSTTFVWSPTDSTHWNTSSDGGAVSDRGSVLNFYASTYPGQSVARAEAFTKETFDLRRVENLSIEYFADNFQTDGLAIIRVFIANEDMSVRTMVDIQSLFGWPVAFTVPRSTYRNLDRARIGWRFTFLNDSGLGNIRLGATVSRIRVVAD